jgi:RNA polymerase sigma factor (sigma-70 family)
MPLTSPDDQTKWFSEEIQPHEPALRAFLHGRFRALSDVDDLIQESYRRLIRAHAAGRVDDAKSYLFTTAKNIALDLWRRNRAGSIDSSVNADVSSVLDNAPDAADALNSAQEFELLKQGLNTLPERCREIMILRKFQGLPNQAIAEKLGISVHTVNAQLVSGLVRCRRYLRKRGVLRGLPS